MKKDYLKPDLERIDFVVKDQVMNDLLEPTLGLGSEVEGWD